MSEMVERVARALDSACFMPAARGEGYQYRRLVAMEKARAAIEAMREPTEAMKLAFSSARPVSPRTVWHEVIDAALTTQTQGDGA